MSIVITLKTAFISVRSDPSDLPIVKNPIEWISLQHFLYLGDN